MFAVVFDNLRRVFSKGFNHSLRGEIMAEASAIPALSDNYIWALHAASAQPGDPVAIVDPGEAKPVLRWLEEQQLRVGAIIITHHHSDHTAGISSLLEHKTATTAAHIPVYGPAAEQDHVPEITHPLSDGDLFTLEWLDLTFSTVAVPGHTLGHIALHAPGMLLAGDTLFRGGCGRVFEGTAAQMQHSLARLRELDGDTRVYCGHEYTQQNLQFAQKVEPDNLDIANAIAEVDDLRNNNRPSLPATIAEERQINPFLRWDNSDVIRAASKRAGRSLTEPADIFASLRTWKDAT